MQLATVNNNAIQGQDITTALFIDFVQYLDRTEKTTRSYINNLRQFMAWLKYSQITAPQREDIILYREWLTAEHEAITLDQEAPQGWKYRTDANGQPVKVSCKAATVKAYLQSVKQFFSWAASKNLYSNIAENIHAPKLTKAHKKDSLTAGEVLAIETLLAQEVQEATTPAAQEQAKRLLAIYLLAVNAGLRTIEISRANIKDLETKNGQTWLYIWGKGHSEADQKKPIAPEVKAAIDSYLAARSDAKTGSSPLFVSTGNRSGGQRIASTTISTMLKRAMQAAGFNSDRLTAHSLRHTAGQNVMQLTGNNIYMTQQYLRHESPATTEIYLENDTAEQDAEIATQLYNRYHNQAPEDKRAQLDLLLEGMTPEQLEQLTGIAAAIRK